MSSINVMEAIWESSEKDEAGSLYYTPPFIDFLWEAGFIDTKEFTPQEWREACKPFFHPDDDLYRFSKEEFLSLDTFRYKGEIKIPFDALRINEGKYTDEGLDNLVLISITPSCGLSDKELVKFIDRLKTKHRQKDGLILIKSEAKQAIQALLKENPSPLRRLEIIFDEYLKALGEAAAEQLAREKGTKLSRVATPEQQTEVQKSVFLQGAASQAEVKAEQLKNLTKAREKSPEPNKPDKGGKPLKEAMRSKKGLRG